LALSREVGNWYTSSVHIARISALRDAPTRDRSFVGDTLLVASYGSGAQAEIHAETVREGWREEIEELDIDDRLAARYDLTWEEYEDVHDVHEYDMTWNARSRSSRSRRRSSSSPAGVG